MSDNPRSPFTQGELEAILERAKQTRAGKSRGYYEDAMLFAGFIERAAPFLKDAAAMLENLTATQTRCTQLKEELRRARLEAQEKQCELEGRITDLEEELEAKEILGFDEHKVTLP